MHLHPADIGVNKTEIPALTGLTLKKGDMG